MKTTSVFKFDFYQPVKQHGWIHINIETKRSSNLKSLSLITCKRVIEKSLLTIKT